jgi:hypothetical protein
MPTDRKKDAISEPTKPLPTFATEAEERSFWEARDSSDYVDWNAAQRAVFPNLNACLSMTSNEET